MSKLVQLLQLIEERNKMCRARTRAVGRVNYYYNSCTNNLSRYNELKEWKPKVTKKWIGKYEELNVIRLQAQTELVAAQTALYTFTKRTTKQMRSLLKELKLKQNKNTVNIIEGLSRRQTHPEYDMYLPFKSVYTKADMKQILLDHEVNQTIEQHLLK